MKSKHGTKTYPVTDPRQRKALTSPLRLEIIGRWSDGKPRSVADLAAEMGRPATSIYYHVHRLEDVGLLERVGNRPGPKRDEILYQPVAEQFDLTPNLNDREQVADTVAAMGAAHRMALGDLKTALESGDVCFDGPDRNLGAFRQHARLSRRERARVNALLDELLAIFEHASVIADRTRAEYCSLTLTLAPLRGRDRKDDS